MKDKAIKDAMNSIENRIRHVYNQGYNDGVNYGIEIGRDFEKSGAYGCGLEDAWECARRVYDMTFEERDIIFSTHDTGAILHPYSASEAMAKIKEYEEKQTEQTRKSGMTLDEAIKHCEEVADSKCDECGAEHRQLAEWLRELKQMKGEVG